ncbi:MAG: DUF1289 domain-containing protein [Bacteroidota bacterium]|jgi:predicted Fe-S protein YdhL (DUF1289 family)
MTTPCLKICKLDKDTETCIGCGRSLEQIRDWVTYTEEERCRITQTLKSGQPKTFDSGQS